MLLQSTALCVLTMMMMIRFHQDNRTRRIKCVYPTEYSWEPKPKVFDLEIVWKRFLPHIDVGVYSAVNACPHTNQIIYYG